MIPLLAQIALPLLAAAPSDALVLKSLPLRAEIETRIDADVTGDGLADTVAVGRAEDDRRLVVLMAGPKGLVRIGETSMDPSPMGSAQLRVTKGVLIVEDLAGGTTAISSLYRWRFDRAVRKMRLIGDDVSFYSRTWTHDGKDISTNRLTGVQVITLQKLNGRNDSADYEPSKPIRKTVSLSPIYMGDEPSPDKTLGWGD